MEDIAKVVAFLASDDAKWISGQTIGVNGAMALCQFEMYKCANKDLYYIGLSIVSIYEKSFNPFYSHCFQPFNSSGSGAGAKPVK